MSLFSSWGSRKYMRTTVHSNIDNQTSVMKFEQSMILNTIEGAFHNSIIECAIKASPHLTGCLSDFFRCHKQLRGQVHYLD